MSKQLVELHQQHWRYFARVMAQAKLAHAYCLLGIDGIGKFSFAKRLARELLCADNHADQVKFDSDNHPDVMYLQSEKKIAVDDVLALHQFVQMKALIAARKVVIIDDASTMTVQAQNKMLKLLEEPPGETLILLVASSSFKLLNTLMSRLVTLRFSPLNSDQIRALAAYHQLDFVPEIASLSGGSFSTYRQWMSQDHFRNQMEALIKLLKDLICGKTEIWLANLDILANFKERPQAFFEVLRFVMTDLFIAQRKLDRRYLRLPLHTACFYQLNKSISSDQIYDMIESIDIAEQALARQQNYTLVSEGLFFHIQEVIYG